MRNSKGFTLIELLIVVVIIGILAAIAIPKFGKTKERAYVAAMKSDLRNLITAEEGYFADNTTYASRATLGTSYSTSAGVTVTTGTVDGTGFSATATHTSGKTCTILVGSQNTGTGAEGEPSCT